MTLPRFSASQALSLGVELELQIVDTEAFDLTPSAVGLLRQMESRKIPGAVKPEMTHSMIELATGVCADHAQTLSQLQDTFVDPGTGEQRSLRDDLLASFDSLESHAIALHAAEALIFLRNEVVTASNDASWIRETHASFGAAAPLSSVVRHQVRRWECSLP